MVNGTGWGFGFGVDPKVLDRFAETAAPREQPFIELDTAAIDELSDVCSRYRIHDNDRVDLHGATKRYWHLESIPEKSDMRTLGYFGILESLLTHKPDPKDPSDSIGRQIRGK
jgi:hypothetical protein